MFLIILSGINLPVSATSAEIKIVTDDPSVRKEVRSVIDQTRRLRLPDSLFAREISARLLDRAYLDVSVDRGEGSWIVTPGETIKGHYLIVTDSLVDTVRINALLTRGNIERTTANVLASSQIDGHYWARLKTDSIVREGNSADLYLTLQPGPVVTIGQVKPIGLVHSDPDLVRRLIGRYSGEPVNDQAIEQITESANDIDWLRLESAPEISPNPGYQSADVVLHMAERRRLSLWGGFGYQSSDNTGLVWELKADLRSLFGRGRMVSLDSERRDRGNQKLDIRYDQPIVWPSVGKFSINLATRDFENRFSEFSIRSGFDLKLNRSTRWGTRVGFKRVEPVTENPGQSLYSVQVSLDRASLNDRFNPSAGYRFNLSLDYVHRRYSNDSLAQRPEQTVLNDTRVAVTAIRFTPVVRKLALLTKAAYEGVESQEEYLPLSEAVLVGGNGTLRGYRNDRFAARRAGLFTVEPRFRFEDGYLFLFYDAAWLGIDQAVVGAYSLKTDYRYGYGIGLALEGEHNRAVVAFGWQPELGIDQPRLTIELGAEL